MVKDQLKNYCLDQNLSFDNNISGSNKKSESLIGIEIEHFILDSQENSVYYENANGYGVHQILEDLSSFYPNKIYSSKKDKNFLIGLSGDDLQISLEPGAQIEISIKASHSIRHINDIYNKFYKNICSVIQAHGYKLVNVGLRPDKSAMEVPLIPKNRYYFMDAYFNTIDKLGNCMMRNTASVQVSLDYFGEQDAQKKFKLAAILSPLIYFLYDNSSVNQLTVQSMARYEIWNHTDSCRCSILKKFFDNDFSYDSYFDAVCDAPLIFAPKEYINLDCNKAIQFENDCFYPNLCIRDIVDNNCILDNEELAHIISMVFFDVRIKKFLELRCADSMPIDYALSYAALLKGIFYNQESLDKLLFILRDVSFEDFISAGKNLQDESWDAHVYGFKIVDLFEKIIDFAKHGLEKNEQMFLEPSIKLINKKQCLMEAISPQQNYFTSCKNNKTFAYSSLTRRNTNFQLEYFLNKEGCLQNRKFALDVHKNSKAIFENKVVDTAYLPKVYGTSQVLQFDSIVKIVYGIWEKLMNLYFEDERFRSLYKWDEFSERLINFRPKYSCTVPISRIDIFYDDATCNFNVCEFNTGGTAAQSEVSNLCDDAQKYEPFVALEKKLNSKNQQIKTWELYKTWVAKFIEIYNEWAQNTGHAFAEKNNNNFTVAIVDFLENSQILDFDTFKAAFKELGYNCIIEDIRHLKYEKGQLLDINGQKINAIYKRATLNDVLPHKDDEGLANLIQAVLEDAVCPIDWFNTQIFHDKQIAYILHDPYTQSFLTMPEVSFIGNHIPKTYRLSKLNFNDIQFIKNKDLYIVKPLNGRRSKNIFSGKEYHNLQWAQILKDCAKIDNYIIQEFCEQYTSPNIEISIDKSDEFLKPDYKNIVKPFANMEGLYCYDGKFVGVWLRQGDHSKSSILYNITTPTFYTE